MGGESDGVEERRKLYRESESETEETEKSVMNENHKVVLCFFAKICSVLLSPPAAGKSRKNNFLSFINLFIKKKEKNYTWVPWMPTDNFKCQSSETNHMTSGKNEREWDVSSPTRPRKSWVVCQEPIRGFNTASITPELLPAPWTDSSAPAAALYSPWNWLVLLILLLFLAAAAAPTMSLIKAGRCVYQRHTALAKLE